jgi:hypothetical protein
MTPSLNILVSSLFPTIQAFHAIQSELLTALLNIL